MTIRQMEFFNAVCEKKSISKAANKLFVSQQALSKSIRELEMELESDLLIRSTNGVTLTPYGKLVYNEFSEILSRCKSIPKDINKLKSTIKETLNLGVAYGIVSAITPEVLTGYQEEFPHVQLNIFDYQDLFCEAKLESGELDVIFTLGPLDAQKFSFYLLKHETMNLCLSNRHPLYNKEIITMEDLKTQKFVVYSDKFHANLNFTAACRRAGFEPNIVFTSNEFNLLEEMSTQNKGIFLMPNHTLRPEAKAVRYVPFPDKRYCWEAFIAIRKGQHQTDGLAGFIQHVMARTEHFRGKKVTLLGPA